MASFEVLLQRNTEVISLFDPTTGENIVVRVPQEQATRINNGHVQNGNLTCHSSVCLMEDCVGLFSVRELANLSDVENGNSLIYLEGMLSLGCKNQCKVAIAFQVYMELCEVLALWDVNYQYNKELELIYLTAKQTKSAPLEIYIPLSAKSGITLAEVATLQNTLCHGEEQKSVTLAVKEQDSSIVLYHMAQGLVLPDNPEVSLAKKRLEGRRNRQQRQLQINKEAIFMRAQNVEMGNDSDTQNNAVEDNDDMQNRVVDSDIDDEFEGEL